MAKAGVNCKPYLIRNCIREAFLLTQCVNFSRSTPMWAVSQSVQQALRPHRAAPEGGANGGGGRFGYGASLPW